jgi:amphi-Trp domain-containing protein
MKRRKIRYADRRTVHACIEQLQAIIDGLKTGDISIQHADESALLRPGGEVELEVRVEQLERKETLRVEMSWRPEPRSLDSAAPEALQNGVHDAVHDGSSAPTPALSEGAALDGAVSHGLAGDGAFANGATGTNGASVPAREKRGPISSRAPDRMLSDHERLLAAFHTQGGDGRWHIDQDGLVQSLARAGVDPLVQQELYALAMQADADGHAAPLSERVIHALEQAGQRQPPSSQS